MPDNLKVYTIIVNYNGGKHNQACLQSLFKQHIDCSHTIVIVDNCSTDDSIQQIEALQHNNIQILKLDKNYLFAYGCNRGMEYALAQGADYIFLLNNDTELEDNCLPKLVNYLQNTLQYSGVQPLLTRMHEPHKVASAGCCISRMGGAWDKDNGKLVSEMPTEAFAVAGITAGACVWRASTLKEIGLFDEDFGMYFEDVDLSLRARKAGYHVCTLPYARVKHMVSATTNQAASGFCVQHCQTNALRLILKHWPDEWLWKDIALWAGVSGLAVVANLGRGNWGTARGIFNGLVKGFLLIPPALACRMTKPTPQNNCTKFCVIRKQFCPPHF